MTRNLRKTLVGVSLVAVIAFAITQPAEAQSKKRRGVIRLEETVIEGRVQKPNAFFINTRQALVYESQELKESFVGDILKAVTDGPF